MADTTERMLRLLATLQTGRSFTGEALAARLEVSPRTLRRDIDRLRDYGYPVHTQPGPGGFYQLLAGRTMPPLALEDDEAVAALLGVATLAASTAGAAGDLDQAASQVFGKLDQFLPARLRPRVAALRSALEASDLSAPPVNADQLASLAEAVESEELVTFRYRDAKGHQSRRRVEPYRHVYLNLRWYLVAWDIGRDDWRAFRADRMSEVVRTGSRFVQRTFPAGSALEFLRQGLNVNRQRVRLVVEVSMSEAADAFKYQDAECEVLAPHRTRITVWSDSWQWLVLTLAFVNADFWIEEPTEFTAACSEFAMQLWTATRTMPPG